MGSFGSKLFEPVKVAAPPEVSSPAKPAPLAAPGAPTSPEQAPVFNNCWSCRVLSGSGLIGAGGYVYWVARKPMKLGYPPGPGTITQMVIGISESWGTVLGRRGQRGKRGALVGHVAGGTPNEMQGRGEEVGTLSLLKISHCFLRTFVSLSLLNFTSSC